MCCKGKKCFGEHSLLVVRVRGAIRLYTVERIRTSEPPIELLTPDGWAPITNIEGTGEESVFEMADWPLYLTAEHVWRPLEAWPCSPPPHIPPATLQKVYDIEVAGSDEIVVGPYVVSVTEKIECLKRKAEKKA